DLGARIHPWIGAEVVVQPELAGGRWLSSTLGVAAYPSGEVYRIGNPEPALILAKLSLRQAAGPVTVTLGKLSTPDLFDNNPVSNDPHTRFMSWGLWASAAYDYPADVRGATWGIALDYTHLWWSARAGMFLEPQVANGAALERDLTKARGLVGELEARSERGAVRVLGGASRLPRFRRLRISHRRRRPSLRDGSPGRGVLPGGPQRAGLPWRELPAALQSGVQPRPRSSAHLHGPGARGVLMPVALNEAPRRRRLVST